MLSDDETGPAGINGAAFETAERAPDVANRRADLADRALAGMTGGWCWCWEDTEAGTTEGTTGEEPAATDTVPDGHVGQMGQAGHCGQGAAQQPEGVEQQPAGSLVQSMGALVGEGGQVCTDVILLGTATS